MTYKGHVICIFDQGNKRIVTRYVVHINWKQNLGKDASLWSSGIYYDFVRQDGISAQRIDRSVWRAVANYSGRDLGMLT